MASRPIYLRDPSYTGKDCMEMLHAIYAQCGISKDDMLRLYNISKSSRPTYVYARHLMLTAAKWPCSYDSRGESRIYTKDPEGYIRDDLTATDYQFHKRVPEFTPLGSPVTNQDVIPVPPVESDIGYILTYDDIGRCILKINKGITELVSMEIDIGNVSKRDIKRMMKRGTINTIMLDEVRVEIQNCGIGDGWDDELVEIRIPPSMKGKHALYGVTISWGLCEDILNAMLKYCTAWRYRVIRVNDEYQLMHKRDSLATFTKYYRSDYELRLMHGNDIVAMIVTCSGHKWWFKGEESKMWDGVCGKLITAVKSSGAPKCVR